MDKEERARIMGTYGAIDQKTDKVIDVPDYGPVVLRKYRFKERCKFKGKVFSVKVDPRTHQQKEVVDTEAMFYWTVLLSIKSLPKQPEYWRLTEEEKIRVVDNLDEEGEFILKEALQLNKLSMTEMGKKNSGNLQEEDKTSK